MDALALLKKDHDQVKKMLKDLDDTTDRAIKTRQDLFERARVEGDLSRTFANALSPRLAEAVFNEVTRRIP